MTFLAMVMKAAHTFILDLADVSKNGIWEEDEGRGWKRRRRRRRQKRGRRAMILSRRRRRKSADPGGSQGGNSGAGTLYSSASSCPRQYSTFLSSARSDLLPSKIIFTDSDAYCNDG
jgi:hypothetical protein